MNDKLLQDLWAVFHFTPRDSEAATRLGDALEDAITEIARLTTIDDAMVERVAILLWARNEEWWLQQTKGYREAGRGSARGIVEAVLRPAE